MKKLFFTIFALMTAISMANNASALNFGTNITIADQQGNTTSEDQEVEPGMQPGQQWDLEGFFQKGSQLSLVGGFNFQNGVSGYPLFSSGDIFIDVNGGTKFGNATRAGSNGNWSEKNTQGYDYAIRFNSFDATNKTSTYSVYALNSESYVLTPFYTQNYGSGPWKYEKNGTLLSTDNIGSYLTGLSAAETGFQGQLHYALTVDLSFLGYDKDFIASYTMGCGNDHALGQGTTPVPEPATMLLFGTGIAGLAGIVRRRMHN